MNPLQELQAIIESLLFRIGDEQLPMPARVDLSVLFPDGCVTHYGFQFHRPSDTPASAESDVDTEEAL